MKHLYLARHAKAAKDLPGITDFERPLTQRGRTDAPSIGTELAQMKVKPDLIMSSPATRAITTARMFADQMDYKKTRIRILEDIYEPWVDDLIDLLQKTESEYDRVMVVGHNPSLQVLAELLADFSEDNLPTSGVIGIRLDIDNWEKLRKGTGEVEFFIYPKALRESD